MVLAEGPYSGHLFVFRGHGVDLSKIRAIDEPDLFGTSDSQMSIFQFSLTRNYA